MSPQEDIHSYYNAYMIHLYVQKFNYMVYELYTLMTYSYKTTHLFIRNNAFVEKSKEKENEKMDLLFINFEPNDKVKR